MGAAVARRFAADGLKAVVNSARSVAAGKELAAELPDAVHLQADVSVEEEARALVQGAVDAYGRLDILVNCAGATESSRTTTWRRRAPRCGGAWTT
ncbi:SDR family NAD(P)-dependent oxidoreductase [Streptomyces sp. cg35]|uniref:SDR family NAD(P)-dependent oxidoreductase n=1 Tax=Streptomyces sp. cg35 TaxID=3421650 RepID=UPI003D187253